MERPDPQASANTFSPSIGQRERRCQPMETADQRKIPFDQLVREHLVSAAKFANQLTGNADLAEEIVQEAMLRAVRGRNSFRGQAKFGTWLFRIIVNVFRDHLKKKSPELLDELHEPKSNEPLPEQQSVNLEMKQQLQNAINQLPERQRSVLVLTTWQHCSAPEVADITGMKIENVYSTLSTARRRLKILLREFLTGDVS